MKDVIIIGGGLSGLVNAILLNRKGHSVILFERKKYPFHRVCGEYLSNEVIPFLEKENLYPHDYDPPKITQFQLTATHGKSLEMPLDLGGFGISRYFYDDWLRKIAEKEGVEVFDGTHVESVLFEKDHFHVKTREKGDFLSTIVIGAFGKRSTLDKKLDRSFIKKRSPYLGVKYHLKTDQVGYDVIALHNFDGGYCGISRVEKDTFNLCYLSRRDRLNEAGNIEALESEILYQNPFLKDIFKNCEFLFEAPEVINEISFSPKEPVDKHILMSGDAAGMITPLCGNGMAMAIHAAKLCSEIVSAFLLNQVTRDEMENIYFHMWNKTFSTRHWAGRKIQTLFGNSFSSNLALTVGKLSPGFSEFLMKQTHGKPFQ